ncbi:Transmembrane protein 256 [Heracleum sosnowskyi]|uniref:Transmembrane protein 256 n=1 Tax=Heracleum sosnowskyi TaxID=360622 RepID=A0AAD8J273_9APIA|nr:Transmembrane protein 256 [Heracleum sosnowskyi]
MNHKELLVAAFSGMAALGLGTYGAHVFKPKNPTYKDVWHTASLYHLVHTAALVAAPLATHPHISQSENCYQVIKGSWQKIEDTAKQHGGLDLLQKSFHICKNAIGANLLSNWLSTAFIYTGMTDYPTPSNFLNPMPAYPVKQMLCRAYLEDRTYSKLAPFGGFAFIAGWATLLF